MVAIKVEKKNGVWNVDDGDGVQQDFRDWAAAIDAAHAMAAKERRGFVVITGGSSPGRLPLRFA